MAFLRGCGWKEQDGIGRGENQKTVKLRVTEPRPKGLGLGANISQSGKQQDLNGGKKKGFEKNTRVKILSGADRGLSGQIKSMDEDNSSCFVELDTNRRIVRVSQFSLEVIESKL
uniref:KOW domain-containing protein n=1 Tax=Ditylenchus dipsaci TaxID=166011 RepID=A0A915E5N9_9BILA